MSTLSLTPKSTRLRDQRLTPAAGLGTYRFANVSAGKAVVGPLTMQGPGTYKPGDNYSGLCTLTGDGNGYTASQLELLGLHVALRCCDRYDQPICVDQCLIDGQRIGEREAWSFGILGRTFGHLIVGNSRFTGGGSFKVPNECHRIYVGRSCSLAVENVTMEGNLAGRDIQVYDERLDGLPPPDFWYVRKSKFGKVEVPGGQMGGYHLLDSNPLILSTFEDCSIHSDYACIRAQGDVLVDGGELIGKGAGVIAAADNIRIELRGVDTSSVARPIDTAGRRGVEVVRS